VSFTKGKGMKQHEAVIEVMRAKGGYATLGQLYQEALSAIIFTNNFPMSALVRTDAAE